MTLSHFNLCVDRHSDSLYRFVLGVVGDRAEAQDVMQEAYVKFWEHRNNIERGKEKSYLFMIAYHDAISAVRKTKVRRAELVDMVGAADNRQYDNTSEIVWRAINSLSDVQREVVMLCDWEGYSYSEIAQVMDLSLPQVKINIYRARVALRKILSDEYKVK